MKLKLNEQEYKRLIDPKWQRGEEKGGFQGLMEALVLRTNRATKEIHLEGEHFKRIRRYAFAYGAGGWQDTLMAIFRRLLGDKLDKYLPPEDEQREML